MLPILALLLSVHTAPAPQADSMAGRWQIKGDVMGNPVNETCTFTQADSVLTGSCAGEDGEAALLAGEVKGGKVTFWHGGDWEGQALTIVYSGTMSSKAELKGTIEVRPMNAAGTFTMTPAPTTDAPAAKP
ncbi:MAG: hypothetical protein ACJ79K_16950 [Gemmatimonadaceae bacterium]